MKTILDSPSKPITDLNKPHASCINCGRSPLKKTETASGLLCASCEEDFISEYIDED